MYIIHTCIYIPMSSHRLRVHVRSDLTQSLKFTLLVCLVPSTCCALPIAVSFAMACVKSEVQAQEYVVKIVGIVSPTDIYNIKVTNQDVFLDLQTIIAENFPDVLDPRQIKLTIPRVESEPHASWNVQDSLCIMH